jgi:hypothetical protein
MFVVVTLLLGAALFVFWPRITHATRRNPAPAIPAQSTMLTLHGDDDDD